jgi:YesN/AraC family two-component response regulator
MDRKCVLLVEDDDVVRDMIKGALEREYNVLEASSCSEATKHIGKPLDLTLIDYDLPDGDGFGVLSRIREAKPKLPVIFMTAYSSDNLAIRAFRTGVTDFIKKPLSLVYLMGKLAEVLGGKLNGEAPDGVESREMFIMDCIAAFIDDNYTEDLTRDKLAEKAHMERHKFSRMFNQRFGMNVKSYLNSVRVKKAAGLLTQNSGLSVADVAVSVGYGGISHFDRVFKEAYGMSPKEYQKNRMRAVSAA